MAFWLLMEEDVRRGKERNNVWKWREKEGKGIPVKQSDSEVVSRMDGGNNSGRQCGGYKSCERSH